MKQTNPGFEQPKGREVPIGRERAPDVKPPKPAGQRPAKPERLSNANPLPPAGRKD